MNLASTKRAAWIVWFVSVANITITYLFFQANPKIGTLVSHLLVLASFAFPAVLLLDAKLHALPKIGALRWIWLYLAFTGLSLFWTSAPLIAATGYWTGVAGAVIATYLLLRIGPVEVVARASLDGYFWGSVFVGAVAWTTGITEDGRLGNQDYLHPNGYAIILAFAVLYGVYLWLNEPRFSTNTATVFLSFTILRSFSKTTIVALMVALGYYIFFRNRVDFKTVAKLVVVLLLLCVLIWPYAEEYWDQYSDSTNVETVTGRTVIWATSADIALERPLLGNGVYSYRFVVPWFGDFEAWQAHNELLQQWFAYGIVGLALGLIIYFTLWIHLRHCPASPQVSLAFACLLFALLHGLTDADIIELSLPLRFALVLAAWTAIEQSDTATAPASVATMIHPRTPHVTNRPAHQN